jgi:hypothetical protein
LQEFEVKKKEKILALVLYHLLLNPFNIRAISGQNQKAHLYLPNFAIASFTSQSQFIGSAFTFSCPLVSVDFWGYSFENRSFHLIGILDRPWQCFLAFFNSSFYKNRKRIQILRWVRREQAFHFKHFFGRFIVLFMLFKASAKYCETHR